MPQVMTAEVALDGGTSRVVPDERTTRRAASAVAGVVAKSVLIAAVVLLVLQWHGRNEGYLTAETGLGYGLGIAGASAMLLMLLYSAQKRLRFMRNFGQAKFWFQIHMLLGLLGPAMIVAHSNFKLGSTNGQIAFFSMLLVAGSGLIGRFIYTRIHQGLYGRRLNVQQLATDVDAARQQLERSVKPLARLQKGLNGLEAQLRKKPGGFLGAIARAFAMAVRTRWLRLVAAASIASASASSTNDEKAPRAERRESRRAARECIAAYLAAVRKEAEFTAYERLFALWHVLHVPLFFILVLATAAHVLIVHMY